MEISLLTLILQRHIEGRILILVAVLLFLVAIYYVGKVKNTFSSIPRLEKPWTVLVVGVILFFVGVLLISVSDVLGINFGYFEDMNDAVLAVAGVFILVAMYMMKKAWTVNESE